MTAGVFIQGDAIDVPLCTPNHPEDIGLDPGAASSQVGSAIRSRGHRGTGVETGRRWMASALPRSWHSGERARGAPRHHDLGAAVEHPDYR